MALIKIPFFFLLQLIIQFLALPCRRNILSSAAAGGRWALLKDNIGIVAMHMQLLHNDRVLIYDRTDFGLSNISLPNGKCRRDTGERALKVDCSAHSVEYDVASNTIRPLMVLTDVWCSSGSVSSDGTLVQTGGNVNGERVVRTFSPCADNTCDWKEINNGLVKRRWYATNHILPDGRQIIIGGRRQFNYEFYPKFTATLAYNLPFLVETNDPRIENNLYPAVFLNVDGNLFIFANNRAILFDYKNDKVVKEFPAIPGGDPRSYPSTGSAVLLPLNLQGSREVSAEVLVCGGAPRGAHVSALNGKFVKALDTCARIRITDPNPQWVMETMPMARVMSDMLLLPNGHVLIINGGSSGTAGWELGRDPVLSPLVYRPNNPIGLRFEVQNPSSIPRMYHSTAILLRDGRILVGGSNPHDYYKFTNVLFPTELRLEMFSPSYFDQNSIRFRPQIISPVSGSTITYKQPVSIRFTSRSKLNKVTVTMISPSFTTHSFSMNQRLLILASGIVKQVRSLVYEVQVMTPNSNTLAPPGFYLVFVVHRDVPSEGIWVQIK